MRGNVHHSNAPALLYLTYFSRSNANLHRWFDFPQTAAKLPANFKQEKMWV
jgi:hypothetical protein